MWSTPFGFPYMPFSAFSGPAVWFYVFYNPVFFTVPRSQSRVFSPPSYWRLPKSRENRHSVVHKNVPLHTVWWM